jgi:hypothetical protein
MKKYTEVEVKETQKQFVSIICDKCKKEEFNIMEIQEWFHYNFIGGYNSIFGDMDEYDIDLCQQCMKELIGPYLRHIADHIMEL